MPSPTPPRSSPQELRPWPLRVVAAVCVLVGAAFFAGSVYLALVGGSWYFAIAGILMLVAGVHLWRGQRAGAWGYGLVLVGSAVWAVWEAGWHFWPLFSRLFVLGGIGMLVALVVPTRPGTARALRRSLSRSCWL